MKGLFQTIRNIFKIKELKSRIFITGFDGLETQHYYSKNGNSQGFTRIGHDPDREKKILSILLESGMVTEL